MRNQGRLDDSRSRSPGLPLLVLLSPRHPVLSSHLVSCISSSFGAREDKLPLETEHPTAAATHLTCQTKLVATSILLLIQRSLTTAGSGVWD